MNLRCWRGRCYKGARGCLEFRKHELTRSVTATSPFHSTPVLRWGCGCPHSPARWPCAVADTLVMWADSLGEVSTSGGSSSWCARVLPRAPMGSSYYTQWPFSSWGACAQEECSGSLLYVFLCDLRFNLGRWAGVILLWFYRYGNFRKGRRKGERKTSHTACRGQIQTSKADRMTLKSFPIKECCFFGVVFKLLVSLLGEN